MRCGESTLIKLKWQKLNELRHRWDLDCFSVVVRTHVQGYVGMTLVICTMQVTSLFRWLDKGLFAKRMMVVEAWRFGGFAGSNLIRFWGIIFR